MNIETKKLVHELVNAQNGLFRVAQVCLDPFFSLTDFYSQNIPGYVSLLSLHF